MTERKRVALLIAATGLFALVAAQVLAHVAFGTVGATMAALAEGGIIVGALAWLGRELQHIRAALDHAKQAPPPAPPPADDRATQSARQRAWLEVMARDLNEGVLLCGMDHRIIHANPAAARLLGDPAQMGPGRPLFGVLSRDPVLRALEELRGSPAPHSVAYAGATPDSMRLLQGHMALVRNPDSSPAGYMLTLADRGREAALLAQDNQLRRTLARELRQPLANMRAAAETLLAYPGISGRERAAFDEVLVEEARILSERVERLEREFRAHAAQRWPMADLHSQDLFNCLARDAARSGIILTMVGIPLWLHGDSPALLSAMRILVAALAEHTGKNEFDLEALLSDRNVTLEIAWMGEPVASATLESWLDRPVEGGISQSVRDVLDRHGAEPWSQKLRNGRTVLRVPLPCPSRAQFTADEPPFSRPEFHDAALMRAHAETGPLGRCLLTDLTYVAFDLETTGLKPEEGHEIIQLGAVRIKDGRVQAGEGFERLVDPGRLIPPDSTRFHGITDIMVDGKPPIGVALRQFKDYAGEAVLVGHNAAFDLAFLDAKQAATGIRIGNPVLDTLLLSLAVEPGSDPSLGALARRLGVAVDPGPSALADALTTAEVMVRLLDALAQRGIRTLDDAMAAQANLAGGL